MVIDNRMKGRNGEVGVNIWRTGGLDDNTALLFWRNCLKSGFHADVSGWEQKIYLFFFKFITGDSLSSLQGVKEYK